MGKWSAATSTSSSVKTITPNNPQANIRIFRTIALIVITLAAIVFIRRWVHHAQLELIPVIVPPGANARESVRPSGGSIVARMLRDVREVISPPQRPRLAVLSFDDGPYPVTTPVLLAQLRALNVAADFFLIGDDVTHQPGIAKEVAAAGMEIANHTLTHPELVALPSPGQLREITGGADAVEKVTGVRTKYFRPPHGGYNADTIVAAQQTGHTVVLWDVDPGDWRTLSADQIVGSSVKQAHAPAVILLHNGKQATIEALPRIVAAYRRAGFEFVTLTELQARVPLDEINNPIRVHM